MSCAPRRLGLLLATLAAAALAFGAASDDALKQQRETLSQARQNYRQSVSQYGENSPQAKQARQNLRSARRSFHQQRRALQGSGGGRGPRRR